MQKEYGLSSSADCYLNKYQKILNEMIQKMTEAELTNSISHNFIVQMIPHHKAAIEMSKNVLCYTENKKLQDIAKGIISEQTKSIENMLEIEGSCEKLENSCKAVDFYQCRTRKIMQVMFAEMSKAYSDNRIDCDFIILHAGGSYLVSEKNKFILSISLFSLCTFQFIKRISGNRINIFVKRFRKIVFIVLIQHFKMITHKFIENTAANFFQ